MLSMVDMPLPTGQENNLLIRVERVHPMAGFDQFTA